MMTERQSKVAKLVTENAGHVTVKQLEAIGYSKGVAKTPGRVVRGKAIQSELSKVLKKHNISLKRAIKPIDDALDAYKPDSRDKQGNVNEGGIDHQTRLKASDMAMKLLQITQPDTKPKEQTTLAPELAAALARGDVDEIQRIIFNKPQVEDTRETLEPIKD